MKQRARKTSPSRLLTEVELELMRILWDLGGGTVRDVMAALPAGRDLAYTSVSTMLRILEQKGAVLSERGERAHRYVPAFGRQEYQGFALEQVVGKVFEGERLQLVRRLVDEGLTAGEIAALRRLLDERTS